MHLKDLGLIFQDTLTLTRTERGGGEGGGLLPKCRGV